MIIKKGAGYIVTQEQSHNNGKGSNPTVTKVIMNDGNTEVNLYGPRIRASSIHVMNKVQPSHDWIKKLRYIFNFNLEEIADMPLHTAKKYVHECMKRDGIL